MKKLFCLIITLAVFIAFSSCGETKVLHCDSCGKETAVSESNKMEEDWLIYCEACHDELFGDDPILGNNQ